MRYFPHCQGICELLALDPNCYLGLHCADRYSANLGSHLGLRDFHPIDRKATMTKRESIQELLWPIRRKEWGRFFPLFLTAFLICINYSFLRALKDTLIITASSSGATLLPFLKIWGVLPAVTGAAALLSFLYRRFSAEEVFRKVMWGFLAFFALFTYLLYPYRDGLAMDGLSDRLLLSLPAGLTPLVELLRHWHLVLFYVAAELWKTMVLMVLFWGFVNARTSYGDARRWYAPLTLAGSLAGVCAGALTHWIAQGGRWEGRFTLLMTLALLIGGVIFFLHEYQAKRLPLLPSTQPEKEPPRSLGRSLAMVVRSPILLGMSLVVLTEYIAFNIVEILWKDRVCALYPDPAEFCRYMGEVQMWTGVVGLFASLFVAANLLRFFGWTLSALLTPLILLGTTLGFFLAPSAAAAVAFGAFHNILARAGRQAFADPAKEMAYLPLSPHLQQQGKAFVDGFLPSAGKSTGSLIQQGLYILGPATVSVGFLAGGVAFSAIGMAIFATWIAGSAFRRAFLGSNLGLRG